MKSMYTWVILAVGISCVQLTHTAENGLNDLTVQGQRANSSHGDIINAVQFVVLVNLIQNNDNQRTATAGQHQGGFANPLKTSNRFLPKNKSYYYQKPWR